MYSMILFKDSAGSLMYDKKRYIITTMLLKECPSRQMLRKVTKNKINSSDPMQYYIA